MSKDYSTRNIIDYAYDDDGKALRDALYAEIHDRISAKFEDRKQQLASTLVAQESYMPAKEGKKKKAMAAMKEHYGPGEVEVFKKMGLIVHKTSMANEETGEMVEFVKIHEYDRETGAIGQEINEEQLDEIDRTALYHKLQAHIASKNKEYSADNAREFSGGKLRDPAEKKASLAKHVAGIRKAQGTLGKVTAQPSKLA